MMIAEAISHMPRDKTDRLLKALIEIGQELASVTDLEELLNRILQISREVFRFENAIIRLLDDDSRLLVAVASYGYDDEAVSQVIRVGQGVMGRAAETGRPVLVEDIQSLPDYVPGIPGARSELAVPLINREKLVGVLNVESPHAGAFSPEDIEPLLTLGRQAAIAIENARLYDRLRNVSAKYKHLHQLNDRILSSINLGVYSVDRDLRITSWNRGIAEMSGVEADDAIGALLPELFPNLVKEGVIERIQTVLDEGAQAKLRLLHRNREDDEPRFQKRRLTPLRDGDKVTGVVVIVEDITEFKRLVDQTIQSEKLVEVGRLSAGIAHEINNPLSIISYALQLLQREGPLNDSQQEMTEKVETEIERLKTLTGSLLSFSSNRVTRSRLVNLNDLLEEVLRLVRFELQRKSVQLVVESSDLPVVSVDPSQIKQVVINLVMNAVQAMAGKGTVTMTTALVDGMVTLRIADTGPGIEAELQEQIFAPFFTTKPEGEGTGLGLYICRNIVREHGGEILLESRPGSGATFIITLPVN